MFKRGLEKKQKELASKQSAKHPYFRLFSLKPIAYSDPVYSKSEPVNEILHLDAMHPEY